MSQRFSWSTRRVRFCVLGGPWRKMVLSRNQHSFQPLFYSSTTKSKHQWRMMQAPNSPSPQSKTSIQYANQSYWSRSAQLQYTQRIIKYSVMYRGVHINILPRSNPQHLTAGDHAIKSTMNNEFR